MRDQITLTVPEAKRFIAKAVVEMPEVVKALGCGRVLLKGGTTVSAVSELLTGRPLRISGRISPRGTVGAKTRSEHPHILLLEGGQVNVVDRDFAQIAQDLGPADVVIIGANAIDARGGAAMMAGSPGGGGTREGISCLYTEGATIIIVAGLEKLIPGSIADAVRAAGRRSVDMSLGAAVGLIPLHGRLITEVTAATLLGRVECTVIGRGGLGNAAGATTMVIEGEPDEVGRVWEAARAVKGSTTSGVPDTLVECERGSPGCAWHRGCVYMRSPGSPHACSRTSESGGRASDAAVPQTEKGKAR